MTVSDNETLPLVIVHGYMNGGVYFYRNFIGLSSYFPSIYAIDLLGWGLSSRPNLSKPNLLLQENNNIDNEKADTHITDSLSVINQKEQHDSHNKNVKIQYVRAAEDFFVESIEAWRVANNIDKFVLAGHSMGGYMSVAYAEKYPQNVDKLILISPAGVPDYTQKIEQQQPQQPDKKPKSSLSKRFIFTVFETLHKSGYTPGTLFRTIPEGVVKAFYIDKVRVVSEQDEQDTLSEYLFYNTALPGSGENCLEMILNDTRQAHDPLVYRINKLNGNYIHSVGFFYGQYDFLDPSGAIQVLLNQQRQQQQEEEAQQQEVSNKNMNRSQNDKSKSPKIEVYIVSDSGHLLMIQNWKEFNNALYLFTKKSNTAKEASTAITTTTAKHDPLVGTTTKEQPTLVRSFTQLASIRNRKQQQSKQQPQLQ